MYITLYYNNIATTAANYMDNDVQYPCKYTIVSDYITIAHIDTATHSYVNSVHFYKI